MSPRAGCVLAAKQRRIPQRRSKFGGAALGERAQCAESGRSNPREGPQCVLAMPSSSEQQSPDPLTVGEPTGQPQPFDPEKLELEHNSTCEYDDDPMERQTDYYTHTTLKYYGKRIFDKTSHGAENIGGLDGYTHTAVLSEDKRTLTIVVSVLGHGGGNKEVETSTYHVADLIHDDSA